MFQLTTDRIVCRNDCRHIFAEDWNYITTRQSKLDCVGRRARTVLR